MREEKSDTQEIIPQLHFYIKTEMLDELHGKYKKNKDISIINNYMIKCIEKYKDSLITFLKNDNSKKYNNYTFDNLIDIMLTQSVIMRLNNLFTPINKIVR